MKLQEIYELAVRIGMETDPRGKEVVEQVLSSQKEKYQKMKKEEQEDFDSESMSNPYSDTRILCGDGSQEVGNVFVGVDMEVGEVLLADRLREKGTPIDLVMSHHPEGKALAGLFDVMHLQEDLLNKLGVPINVAQGILSSRISEVKRALMPLNHNRAVDAAKLLNLPLMSVHTPADNLVTDYLTRIFEERKPYLVEDVVDMLKEIPEYREAARNSAGPTVVVGSKDKRAGNVFVDMSGGTGGSEDAYSKLAQVGIGTVVGMHIGEKHRKEAEKNHINVVIAGHIASDSLGMNLFLDQLVSRGVKVITCSGLIRVERG